MEKLKCPYCDREPVNIPEYVQGAEMEEMTPEQYVKSEEGTYCKKHNLFVCTDCYIRIGMPLNNQLYFAFSLYRNEGVLVGN